MDATSPYREAADRARVIAAVARDRFGPPETLRILGDIARHLSAAADHFAAYTPSATPGLAGHDFPAEAAGELWIAETLAYDHPAARFPMEFTQYVKAPFTGLMPFPDPLNPLSDRFAQQETELRNRLEQLHADTARATEDVVQWLTEILTVWRDWMRLAEVVRVDNNQPHHRR
jgi:hypothetical protein